MLIADWSVWCTVSSKSKPIKGAGFRKKLSFGNISHEGKTEFSCVVKSWKIFSPRGKTEFSCAY